MPQASVPIIIPYNAVSGAYDLAPADYQKLASALLLSTNPDGTEIQVTVTAVVYNPTVLAQSLQAQETVIQNEINTATAAAQDVNP